MTLQLHQYRYSTKNQLFHQHKAKAYIATWQLVIISFRSVAHLPPSYNTVTTLALKNKKKSSYGRCISQHTKGKGDIQYLTLCSIYLFNMTVQMALNILLNLKEKTLKHSLNIRSYISSWLTISNKNKIKGFPDASALASFFLMH